MGNISGGIVVAIVLATGKENTVQNAHVIYMRRESEPKAVSDRAPSSNIVGFIG